MVARKAKIRRTRTGRRNRHSYDGGLPKLRRRGDSMPFSLLGAVEHRSLLARTDPERALRLHHNKRKLSKATGVLAHHNRLRDDLFTRRRNRF
jgi:hypothetical protein